MSTLEELKQQLKAGAISTKEYEEATKAIGAPTPLTPNHNWRVAEGHWKDCTCITCVRMNSA